MSMKEQRDSKSPAARKKPAGGLAPPDTKTQGKGIHCAGASTESKSAEPRASRKDHTRRRWAACWTEQALQVNGERLVESVNSTGTIHQPRAKR